MQINSFTIDDLPSVESSIAKFLSVGFPSDSADLWKKRFAYWWKENPYVIGDEVIGWYLQDAESSRIGGFIGKIPLAYLHGGEYLRACAGTSWYVIDEMRGIQSTRLFMKYNKEKNTDLYLDTTPTVPVQKMLPDIGFVKMGGEKIHNYMIISSLGSFSSMMSTLLHHFADSETGWLQKAFLSASKAGHLASKILPKAKPKPNLPLPETREYKLRVCEDAETFIRHYSAHKKGDTIELARDKKTLDWIFYSPAVQELLHRKVVQVFSGGGKYCGYFIYDQQHVGDVTTIRLRELKLLHPDNQLIKLIIRYLKTEAKRHGCAAVYSGLQADDDEVDKLLRKNILLHLDTDNRYYVKFRKKAVTDVDPYSIYVPSDIDPDAGFI